MPLRLKKLEKSLIKWWTDFPYSHVAVMFYSESLEEELVYHAAHGMVHFISGNNFRTVNKVVKEHSIIVTDAQYKALMKLGRTFTKPLFLVRPDDVERALLSYGKTKV